MIKIKDYKKIILDWTSNKRKLKEKEEDLIRFFENGFKNTNIPSDVYFGGNNNAISFIIGGIYLLAYVHTGESKGIWMIEDKINNTLNSSSIIQEEIKSTKKCENKLYWIHFKNLNELRNINENKLVWESYKRASSIIKNTPFAKFIRKDYIEGKALLTAFWDYLDNDIKIFENINDEFEKEVIISKNYLSSERLTRLQNACKIPEKVIVKTVVYKRNPDVVAEVLARANGRCELCHNKAPFIRASDGTPYLEVHHKIELSKGGEDTCENALALCPNCHRKQHYGIYFNI